MKYIDLHNHTTASDGTFTPSEAVAHAAEKGLAAIAITDHDTDDGAEAAMAAAAAYGVEVIPGIEISTDYMGYGVHILGYFIEPNHPGMAPVLNWINTDRDRRNGEIAQLMRRDGIDISLEELQAEHPDSIIGRPHFAQALVDRGLADSVADAFKKYLNRGCCYFRSRKFISVDGALEAIAAAGGKAVFAHPLQYRMEHDALLVLTKRLTDAGVVGMECLYSLYSPEQSEYLMGIAKDFGLCVTGGSDFHGAAKPHIDMGTGTGSLRVPYELLEILKTK